MVIHCASLLGWIQFWIHVGFIPPFSCGFLICVCCTDNLQGHFHFALFTVVAMISNIVFNLSKPGLVDSDFDAFVQKQFQFLPNAEDSSYLHQEPSFHPVQWNKATIL